MCCKWQLWAANTYTVTLLLMTFLQFRWPMKWLMSYGFVEKRWNRLESDIRIWVTFSWLPCLKFDYILSRAEDAQSCQETAATEPIVFGVISSNLLPYFLMRRCAKWDGERTTTCNFMTRHTSDCLSDAGWRCLAAAEQRCDAALEAWRRPKTWQKSWWTKFTRRRGKSPLKRSRGVIYGWIKIHILFLFVRRLERTFVADSDGVASAAWRNYLPVLLFVRMGECLKSQLSYRRRTEHRWRLIDF